MNSFDIIKTVRVTEKGTTQADSLNQYTVVADLKANKIQIRSAVEDLFNVKVLRVNTMNVSGKEKRKRTHQRGWTSDWKKAIVTLKDGDSITLT